MARGAFYFGRGHGDFIQWYCGIWKGETYLIIFMSLLKIVPYNTAVTSPVTIVFEQASLAQVLNKLFWQPVFKQASSIEFEQASLAWDSNKHLEEILAWDLNKHL